MTAEYAAVIGDVVSSRQAEDQALLFSRLTDALEWVNNLTTPRQPLQVTLGDEIQGVYNSGGEVIHAALMLVLKLGADVEMRFGIGWGGVFAHEPEQLPWAQSGSAWWNAREAIAQVGDVVGQQQWPRSLRTQARGFPDDACLNAMFICRDELIASMDGRDRRIALGLFVGEKQRDLATTLGISQPSVARRQKDKGINALFRAQQLLMSVEL